MGPKTAIIAGTGNLPVLLARRLEADGVAFLLAELQGFTADNPGGWPVEPFLVERLALLFSRLDELGVTRVVFAGAVRRPALDPALIDPQTAALLPRLLPAFQDGDDALLRAVIALFEEAGFAVVGAAEIAPELVPGEGVLTETQPSEVDRADAARAAEIVAALGPVELGEGRWWRRGCAWPSKRCPARRRCWTGWPLWQVATGPTRKARRAFSTKRRSRGRSCASICP